MMYNDALPIERYYAPGSEGGEPFPEKMQPLSFWSMT